MPRFITKKKGNVFKRAWQAFNSSDLFTKYVLITCILLFLATPFMIYNKQTYNVGAITQAQRLEEIQQIQHSQFNLRKDLAKAPLESQQVDNNVADSNEFSLSNIIRSIFMQIISLFR